MRVRVSSFSLSSGKRGGSVGVEATAVGAVVTLVRFLAVVGVGDHVGVVVVRLLLVARNHRLGVVHALADFGHLVGAEVRLVLLLGVDAIEAGLRGLV